MHGAENEAYFEGDRKILNPPYRKRQVCSFGLYFICFALYIILGLPFPVGSRLFPSKFLTLYRTSKFAFFGLFIFDFFCKMLLTKTLLFSIIKTFAASDLLTFFPLFSEMVWLKPDPAGDDQKTLCRVVNTLPNSNREKISIVVRPTYTVEQVYKNIETQFNYSSFDLVLDSKETKVSVYPGLGILFC